MKNTVSLIISTYNWAQALDVVLHSVMNQTRIPDEVIIADDGSREDTANLIKKSEQEMPCPLIHVWHEDNGFRLATIRNKAIAKSSCDYIIQIDGDIVLEKHFVEDHMKLAERGCFIAGSRVMISEELTNTVLKEKKIDLTPYTKGVRHIFNAMRFAPLTAYYKFRYRAYDPYYGKGCNMSFWRDDLIAVNGYNEDMTGWGKEDSELIVRLMNAGRRKKYIKFAGVGYHLEHPLKSRGREVINTGYFNRAIEEKITWIENGLNQHLSK